MIVLLRILLVFGCVLYAFADADAVRAAFDHSYKGILLFFKKKKKRTLKSIDLYFSFYICKKYTAYMQHAFPKDELEPV